MTAADVKAALRGRHPAVDQGMVGPWTTLEEYRGVDLLAVAAWRSLRYARIGYEVKVSRSDLRRELLKPHKRARNVAWCHEFYFAVPVGLLTTEEITWTEPAWEPGDFSRTPCPNTGDERGRGGCHRGRCDRPLLGPLRKQEFCRSFISVECPDCGGKGYGDRSRVEREAPTLWVPADVGLVTVMGDGRTRIVKQAPKRRPTPEERKVDGMLADAIRWASARPDPRHVEAFLRLHDAHTQMAVREIAST